MLSACAGDDTTYGSVDASVDAPAFDGTVDPPETDGGVDASDAQPSERPPWLLMSLHGSEQSEMVAFSLAANAVDGRLAYEGTMGATYAADDGTLWLLQQEIDRVVRLDPDAPWRGGASWNVRLDDRADGGYANANPIAVVAGPVGKAYALRFNRNRIAILDTNQAGDASAPIGSIDLSSFVDPDDSDRYVEVVGAVYLASRRQLLVLLGNVDLNQVDPQGYFALCTALKPRLIAIDTTTDTIVAPLDGGLEPSAIDLAGYNPLSAGLVLDAPRARLLVLHSGCNPPSGTVGVPGPTERRGVEAIDLATGAVSTVLDLSSRGYPSAWRRLDADHFVLGFDFGYETFVWDVRTAALGASVQGAPSLMAYDGRGTFVGITTDYLPDGGSISNVVSSKLEGDGGTTVLAPVPFPSTGGFASGVDFWAP